MNQAQWLSSTDPAAMLKYLQSFPPDDDGIRWDRMKPLISDRKLRLLACAVARLLPYQTSGAMKAIEQAERLADGKHWSLSGPIEWIILRRDAMAAATGIIEYVAGLHPLSRRPVPATLAALLRSIVQPFSPVTLPAGEPQRCPTCKGQKWVYTGEEPDEEEDYACATCGKRSGLYGHYNFGTGEQTCTKEDCLDCHGKGTIDGPCPWLTPLVVSLAANAYEDNGGRKCRYCNGGPPDLCDRCDHNSGWIGVGTLDPDRLAVLSDAAEDAGCEDERVLRHLRGWVMCLCHEHVSRGTNRVPCSGMDSNWCDGSGWLKSSVPFVRGDWCLDLFLGYS